MILTLDICAVVFQNMQRMLKDRHYEIIRAVSAARFFPQRVTGDTLSVEDIGNMIFLEARNGTQKVVAILAAEENHSVGVAQIRQFVEFVADEDYGRVILVFQKEPSAQARQELDAVAQDCTFEVFQLKELMFIVVDHYLVPKHIPLTEEKAKEELKKRGLDRRNLPVLRSHDPIARYYGLKSGNVVAILVESTINGVFLKFRQVKS
jgi:DNA-directed RNA polymerase subunit H (RpoH/RPB5)